MLYVHFPIFSLLTDVTKVFQNFSVTQAEARGLALRHGRLSRWDVTADTPRHTRLNTVLGDMSSDSRRGRSECVTCRYNTSEGCVLPQSSITAHTYITVHSALLNWNNLLGTVTLREVKSLPGALEAFSPSSAEWCVYTN